MKCGSLWFELRGGKNATPTVTLRRCLNCGQVKLTSDPCGFDHLAALLEFRRDIATLEAERA